LSVLLVSVLLVSMSVVERPTRVSETFGSVSVSFAVCVVASVVDVAVVASTLLNNNCLVLSVALYTANSESPKVT